MGVVNSHILPGDLVYTIDHARLTVDHPDEIQLTPCCDATNGSFRIAPHTECTIIAVMPSKTPMGLAFYVMINSSLQIGWMRNYMVCPYIVQHDVVKHT